MARTTSITAYNNLKKTKALSKRRWTVYRYIYKNGPLLQTDLKHKLNDVTHSLVPRFAELDKMGLIHGVGHAVSEDTGKTGILWDVTDREFPLPLPKKVTCKKLEEDNHIMRTMLKSIAFNTKCSKTKSYIKEKLPK